MEGRFSASFQAVEDWLRSLGLLHYAQSFYDNGYEDMETCRIVKAEDLNVMGIRIERDRKDILYAVHGLEQNIYFELEPGSAAETERTKIEELFLKTKLKEFLEREKIDLSVPPYYNNIDGSVGDLYTLAIRYAAELTTFFDDVLEALEKLRERQLPIRDLNMHINDGTSKSVSREKDKSKTIDSRTTLRDSRYMLRTASHESNKHPAEYLNCETFPRRSATFSKYDMRLTKSTENISESSDSASIMSPKKKKKSVRRFFGSVSSGRKSFVSVNLKGEVTDSTPKTISEFNASDLTFTQNEILDIFQQVKNKELSQDDVLNVIKERGLSVKKKGRVEEDAKNIDSSLSTLITSPSAERLESINISSSESEMTEIAVASLQQYSPMSPIGDKYSSLHTQIEGDDSKVNTPFPKLKLHAVNKGGLFKKRLEKDVTATRSPHGATISSNTNSYSGLGIYPYNYCKGTANISELNKETTEIASHASNMSLNCNGCDPSPAQEVDTAGTLHTPNNSYIKAVELKNTKIVKRNMRDIVSQKQLVAKMLRRENINIAITPYTSNEGSWCIPYNLVLRYAHELPFSVGDIIKAFEEIRLDERLSNHLPYKPYCAEHLGMERTLHENFSIEEYLTFIGLPMYMDDFQDVNIESIDEISEFDDDDVKHIGIFNNRHITWLLKSRDNMQNGNFYHFECTNKCCVWN